MLACEAGRDKGMRGQEWENLCCAEAWGKVNTFLRPNCALQGKADVKDDRSQTLREVLRDLQKAWGFIILNDAVASPKIASGVRWLDFGF